MPGTLSKLFIEDVQRVRTTLCVSVAFSLLTHVLRQTWKPRCHDIKTSMNAVGRSHSDKADITGRPAPSKPNPNVSHRYFVITSTDSMITSSNGLSPASVSTRAMLSNTSIPSMTCPNTVWLKSRCGVPPNSK